MNPVDFPSERTMNNESTYADHDCQINIVSSVNPEVIGVTHKKWPALIDFFVFYVGLALMVKCAGQKVGHDTTYDLRLRYDLSAQEANMFRDMEYTTILAALVFLGYFGNAIHKPIAMAVGSILYGLGCLICSSVYFLSGPLDDMTVSQRHAIDQASTCMAHRPEPPRDEDGDIDHCYYIRWSELMVKGSFSLLCVGQLIIGIATALMLSVPVVYIEENRRQLRYGSTYAYGFLFFCMSFGYFLGTLLTLALGSLPEQINGKSPLVAHYLNSIGAWWLCYIVIAILCPLTCVRLFTFPRWLTQPKWMLRRIERNEQRRKAQAERMKLQRNLAKKKKLKSKNGAIIAAKKKTLPELRTTASDKRKLQLSPTPSTPDHPNTASSTPNTTTSSTTSSTATSTATAATVAIVNDPPATCSTTTSYTSDDSPPAICSTTSSTTTHDDPTATKANGSLDLKPTCSAIATPLVDGATASLPTKHPAIEGDTNPTNPRQLQQIATIESLKTPRDSTLTPTHPRTSAIGKKIKECQSKSEVKKTTTPPKGLFLGRQCSDLPRNLIYFAKQPVYMLTVLACCSLAYFYSWYWSQLPFYFQRQFRVDIKASELASGLTFSIGSMVGIILSSVIIKKLSLDIKKQALFALCGVSLTFIFITILHSFGCNDSMTDNTIDNMRSCSRTCNCESVSKQSLTFPVCSQSGKKIFSSPCVAGCINYYRHPDTDTMIHTNCSCTPGTSISRSWCKPCYGHYLGFMLFHFLAIICQTSSAVPVIHILLRKFPAELRCLSIGFALWIIYLIAILPGRAIFSTIKKNKCDIGGSTHSVLQCSRGEECWLLDASSYRVAAIMVTMCTQFIGMLCFFFVYDYIEPTPEKKTLENTENVSHA